jgi:hypothetical protein
MSTTRDDALRRVELIGDATYEFLSSIVETLRRYEFPEGQLPVISREICRLEPEKFIRCVSDRIGTGFSFPLLSGRALSHVPENIGPRSVTRTEPRSYSNQLHGSDARLGHPWFPILEQIAMDAEVYPKDYLGYLCFLPYYPCNRGGEKWRPLVASTMCTTCRRDRLVELHECDFLDNDDDRTAVSVQTFETFSELIAQACCLQWADKSVYDKNRPKWRVEAGVPVFPLFAESMWGNFLSKVCRAETEGDVFRECLHFAVCIPFYKELKKKVSRVTGTRALPLASEFGHMEKQVRRSIMRVITDSAKEWYAEEQKKIYEFDKKAKDDLRKDQE